MYRTTSGAFSAVGPEPLSTCTVPGFRLGIASAGIKRPGRKDVCGSQPFVPGLQRSRRVHPQCVLRRAGDPWQKRVLGSVRYLLTSTGNASGYRQARPANAVRTCAALAKLTDVDERAVLPFSRSVIGEPLPVEKIEVRCKLRWTLVQYWANAATGIMTTDTLPRVPVVRICRWRHRYRDRHQQVQA
jgi:glutamate N-acetyltransferase/amino-acid N-acetyltransferase